MACNLMASGSDTLDELRRSLRDPAQHEERAAHTSFGEHFENPIGIALDAVFASPPAVPRDRRRERGDLEVVFHVHREGVENPPQDNPRLAAMTRAFLEGL